MSYITTTDFTQPTIDGLEKLKQLGITILKTKEQYAYKLAVPKESTHILRSSSPEEDFLWYLLVILAVVFLGFFLMALLKGWHKATVFCFVGFILIPYVLFHSLDAKSEEIAKHNEYAESTKYREYEESIYTVILPKDEADLQELYEDFYYSKDRNEYKGLDAVDIYLRAKNKPAETQQQEKNYDG